MMARAARRSVTRNLATGTLLRYALLMVNIAIGFWLMPFSVGHLGKSEYGLWMLVASMTAYFQLLDLGYGNGLVRQISDADARGDEQAINRIASTFVVVYGAIGIVALAAIIGLSVWVVPRFPNLDEAQVRTAQWVTVVLGVRIAVGFPMTVFGAVTSSRQYFALSTAIALAVVLATALVTYAVLESGYGLRPLVACTTAVNLLAYLGYARAARHAYPGLRLQPSLFSWQQMKAVSSYSLYVFLIGIAAQLGFNLDNLVIGAFVGTSAVAVYTVAARLAEHQRSLSNQFNGLLFPVVVGFGARNDIERLRATLLHATRLSFGLVLGVTVCMLGFAGPLVGLWMGDSFAEAVTALYALAAAGVALVTAGPVGNILLGTGRHRLVAFAALAESLVNVALSVFLVRRWGLAGVAVGTAIPMLANNLLVLMPIACRSLEVPFFQFVRATMLPGLLSALPALAAVAVLRLIAPPTSLPAVILEGALVGLVYATGFVTLGLPSAERKRYLSQIRAMLGDHRGRLAEAEGRG